MKEELGYNATLIAPTVTRDLLMVFENQVYTSKRKDNTDYLEITVNRHPEKTPGEATIIYKEPKGKREEPIISVGATPDVAAGIDVSVEGPASNWMLTQRIDDGNLLTELVYNNQAILGIHGASARMKDGNIKIRGEQDDDPLIPEKHRI